MKNLLKLLVTSLVMFANTNLAQTDKIYNRFPEDYKQKVFKHIINITNIGVHSAGTIEEKQAANYILNEFDKIGFETSIEAFEFESFDITNTELRINNKNIEVKQVCFNPYTSLTFEFDGEFVLLEEDNTTEDDISDKIVLASFPLGNMNFFKLFFAKPRLILVIPPNDYLRIVREKNRSIQCEITGKIDKYQSQNVVGLIKAGHKTKNEIIISAHYDSYPGSVGADDNASGVGTIIELARYFFQIRESLSTNIKFVSFGGEEKGLLGSRAYLNHNKDKIEDCILLFNIDQIGGENIFIETEGGVQGISEIIGETQFPDYMRNRSLEGIKSNWRILAPEAMNIFSISNRPLWLLDIIKNSAEELLIPVKYVGNTGSDQMSFAQAGIAATAIGTSGNEYHSALDMPSQINKQSLVDGSKIVISVVLKTMERNVTR